MGMSEDEIRKEFETWFEHKMSLAPLSMNNSLRMCARELMLEAYRAGRNAALEAAAKKAEASVSREQAAHAIRALKEQSNG